MATPLTTGQQTKFNRVYNRDGRQLEFGFQTKVYFVPFRLGVVGPKSVRKRCVIEDFGGVFVLSLSFFGFFFLVFCGCLKGCCRKNESNLFFFLVSIKEGYLQCLMCVL